MHSADVVAHQAAARQLMEAAWDGRTKLTWKAASFVGQVSLATQPLSKPQAEWLDQLRERAGLDPTAGGSA